jgi:hypothetical protein
MLDGDIVYAVDRGEKNIELFGCFPGRKIYLYSGTLDKGLLVPLTQEGNQAVAGDPISLPQRGEKIAEFVSDPVRMFHLYSSEFQAFLERLYRDNDPLGMDIPRLEALGLGYKEGGEFQRAAFCFEAALQLENSPQARKVLVNLLIPCYRKTGQTKEALILMRKNSEGDFDGFKYYNILPERGF